jgi:hypothetical protein
MPIERKKVSAALLAKGFRNRQNDHAFFCLWVGNQKTSVFTKISHGSGYKDLDDSLVGKMAKQVGLSIGQFRDYVECNLSENEYVEILRQRRRIQ